MKLFCFDYDKLVSDNNDLHKALEKWIKIAAKQQFEIDSLKKKIKELSNE